MGLEWFKEDNAHRKVMNWKLRGLGQLLSHYSGPCYLLLRLTERVLLTSAGFGSDLESPWPGGLELCSWLTQTLPSKAGGGKNHDFMRDCVNTFLPGHLTFSYVFLLEETGNGHSMQVVQEAPQAFISQLIPGETERQKNKVANQNSAF